LIAKKASSDNKNVNNYREEVKNNGKAYSKDLYYERGHYSGNPEQYDQDYRGNQSAKEYAVNLVICETVKICIDRFVHHYSTCMPRSVFFRLYTLKKAIDKNGMNTEKILATITTIPDSKRALRK
jgi:hypothetical protein